MSYVYCLSGATVFWSSKKVKTIVISLTGVEYIMLSNILEQAIWMKKFINNFQALNCIDILPILGNNMFNIKITKNNKFYR